MDSRQIERSAADWLARRDGGRWSAAEQAALDAWLAADTAHRVAFLRLQAAWRQGGRLKALGAGLPAGVVPARGQWAQAAFTARAARPADAGDAAQPAVDFSRLRFAPRPPARAPRWPLRVGAACALLLALASTYGWHRHAAVERADYASGVGDLQPVQLADGSQATLSSDSRIQVALSRAQRRIDLQRGEAFFEAARDPARPFVVDAGAHRAVAVGTRFSVRRDGERMRVVVTEGLVRLESGDPRAPSTLLPAGSVALAGPDGVLVRSVPVDEAERHLDWRNGYLSFDDVSLAEAADEFNRYNARKLVVADPAAAALRVGGNFRWSNTEPFVALLEQGFPVRAERHPERIVLHSR